MHKYLSLSTIAKYEPLAEELGVSEVARSPRGFLAAYKRAKGNPGNLSPEWWDKREAFIKRHMAQVHMRGEALWKDGEPSRRHLALIMWAYSPGLRENPEQLGPNELFDELIEIIRESHPDFECRLVVDNKKALAGRKEKRAYAACDGDNIYVATKIYDAPYERYEGILMHELGHAILIQAGEEDHTEHEADQVAKTYFGKTIRYDNEDVQTTGRGVSPRPAHLE